MDTLDWGRVGIVLGAATKKRSPLESSFVQEKSVSNIILNIVPFVVVMVLISWLFVYGHWAKSNKELLELLFLLFTFWLISSFKRNVINIFGG